MLGRIVAATLVSGLGLGSLSAALTSVLEYSFPASYSTPPTLVDQGPAGNDATLDLNAALIDDRPAGFDPSLMSLTGANGGHGQTVALDLLTNTDIGAAGGFTLDVWFSWEGTFTNTRKLIDYAGTDWLRTSNSEIQFGLSNGGTVVTHPIVANQWYHAVAVFDTTGNVAEADPGYVGEQRILGDAYLYIDDVLVDSAENVYKNGFGDSLNRPIGINRWAGGGADWNQGRIFEPKVYLGVVPEPSVSLLLVCGSLGLLRRVRK